MTSTRPHTVGKDRQRTAGACVAAALLVAGAVASGPQPRAVVDSAVPLQPLGAAPSPVAPKPGVDLPLPLPATELPGPVAPRIQLVAAYQPGSSTPSNVSATGIPAVALAAYTNAAAVLARRDPSCGLPWSMLAGIGRVESNHGRFGGATLGADGYPSPPIRGIPLDGRPGVALIRATDGGKWTGDPVFERAVGPMQFIPSTWRSAGADGNGDGAADPNNIHDAALAAAGYLCSGGGDLRTDTGARAAVFRYNHSQSYVTTVLSLARDYEHGIAAELPSNPVGEVSEPTRGHDLPPASVTVLDAQHPAAAPATSAPTQAEPASPPAAQPTGSPRPPHHERPGTSAVAPVKEPDDHTGARPASPADTQLAPDITDAVHEAICEMAAKLPGTTQQAIKRAAVTVFRRQGLKPAKPPTSAVCRAVTLSRNPRPVEETTRPDEAADSSADRQRSPAVRNAGAPE
ncbi:lytic transglycosylase domain-containing protein [Amycolatopsis thailandensis]|uniref:lytic transglycosylase domain-containing protein n=1 Tax=Amycolatopsis thailandensis TaxID=589330 RepID=UPI0037A1946F